MTRINSDHGFPRVSRRLSGYIITIMAMMYPDVSLPRAKFEPGFVANGNSFPISAKFLLALAPLGPLFLDCRSECASVSHWKIV
jgi:hypothetical protein